MMNAIRRSISRKFLLAVLATTFVALLIMGASMLFHDLDTFKAAWVSDLTAQADILAKVSAPALEFNDPKAAAENLEQVRARPNILGAAIYSSRNTLFAEFVTDPSIALPATPGPSGFEINGGQIAVFRDVVLNGEKTGVIFLTARFPLGDRIWSYVTILSAVTLVCLVFAAAVSMWLQRAITRPILSLTDAVGNVVERRDFSIRVKKTTGDEIGVLVDAFNSMLGEVGDRSQALETSNLALLRETKERRDAEDALRVLNNTLEERIAERTTELERAHEQLRQAQKMEAIGQLTGGIAHDFNNLLTGMSGNLELMRMRIARGEIDEIERYAKSAMASVERAAALTHRLLAFARRQTLDPKPTDVGRLLGSMEEMIRRSVGPAIRVETSAAADPWNTLCDPHQLENAVLNLAINARDAMPDGGTLTINNRNLTVSGGDADPAELRGRPGEYVVIEVIDTGSGMPPEIVSRAFDPFFTTKPLGQGTGLGLSMIYGFVTQSGGHVQIKSKPGAGTCVTIHLSRHKGASLPAREEREMQALSRTESHKTVLIVDDEAAIRNNLAEMLEDLGYEVLQAEDGRSGLALVRSGRRIDLLVSDVGLPNGMNGRQLAYANTNIVGDGRMEPGMEVLTKPFAMENFASRVNGMLDGS
jgi:signal transduction histidine kinase